MCSQVAKRLYRDQKEDLLRTLTTLVEHSDSAHHSHMLITAFSMNPVLSDLQRLHAHMAYSNSQNLMWIQTKTNQSINALIKISLIQNCHFSKKVGEYPHITTLQTPWERLNEPPFIYCTCPKGSLLICCEWKKRDQVPRQDWLTLLKVLHFYQIHRILNY